MSAPNANSGATRPSITVMARDASGAEAGKPLCAARLSRGGQHTGKTCSKPKGWQTDHPGYGNCKFHGGDTPNGKKFAAEELAREIAERRRVDVGLFGGRSVVQPHDVLLEELGRSHALVRNIEASMSEWAEQQYLDTSNSNSGGELEDKSGIESGEVNNGVSGWGETLTGLPQLVSVHMTEYRIGFTDTEWAAWIKVYREERQHLVKVAQACAALGVLERHQRMLEANARFMRRVLERGLEALGVQAEPERVAAVMQDSIRYVVQETSQLAAAR